MPFDTCCYDWEMTMTDTSTPTTDAAAEPIGVPASPLPSALRGQLRIWLAVVAGGLIARHLLPDWLASDAVLDALAGALFLAAASGWQWLSAKLAHSKLVTIAADPRVPDAVAFVQPSAPANA